MIASFSDVAASGGYYVACGADRIVSQPATYTGSIGVFVLRPILGGLFEKLGVGVEAMTRGEHADLLLASRPLSPRTRRRLRADVRGVYETFVGRVAEGRELTPEAVDAIGQGRVWTGAQASEIGLVDVLGGLRTAVLEAEERGRPRRGCRRGADLLPPAEAPRPADPRTPWAPRFAPRCLRSRFRPRSASSSPPSRCFPPEPRS